MGRPRETAHVGVRRGRSRRASLGEKMADRIFTLEAAQAMVPWLEDQFQVIGALGKRANALSNEIRRLGLEARSRLGRSLKATRAWEYR